MPSHKSAFTNFVSCLALLILFSATTGATLAQTPTGSSGEPRGGATGSEPNSTAAKPAANNPAVGSAEASKPAPAQVKSEAESTNAKAESSSTGAASSDTKTDAPKATAVSAAQAPAQAPCQRTIKADVVAIPQPIMLNRLGAAIPDGLVFTLKGDTVNGAGAQLRPDRRPRPLVLRANVGDCLTITFTNSIPIDNFTKTVTAAANTGTTETSIHIQGVEWVTGSGDDGTFVGQNNSSLASAASPSPTPTPMPPQTQTYTLFAKDEGTFLMYTTGDMSSTGIQLARGLFGALNVQPKGAEWYRSQVSADDLALATYNANRPDQVPAGSLNCTTATNCTFHFNGKTVKVLKTPGGYLHTLDNHPLVDYDAVYPSKRADGTSLPANVVGTPILKMLDAKLNIVHGDLTAIITGPHAGRFPGANGNPNKPDPPCNAENNPALGGGPVDPLFCQNPASPDRKQPYREITVIYHGGLGPLSSQAFPVMQNTPSNPLAATTVAGQDAFAINYGTGGIGAEIYANRIGVGPEGDCVDCKYEEFFLSAWSVGDPAMLVDRPANSSLQPAFTSSPAEAPLPSTTPPPPVLCTSTQLGDTGAAPDPNCANSRQPTFNGQPYTLAPLVKAARVYYPDDPSNVYHSYINDHVKFRILHGGRDVSHVHHQHAHQWLQSPNSDEGSYLDSQMISPGASYTLEMVYNGSGNRNKVVGDSIFHCHFYPHFAAGMWALWRTHDTFESGTYVYPQGKTINGTDMSGQVVPGSRALPDGEIGAGSPTPAVVPLPTLPMAPLPAYAQIQHNVKVNGAQITIGGQIVLGGTCQANKVNGLDVIGGCADGTTVNGTVINSQFDGNKMTGQFRPSAGNNIENPGFPYFIPGIAGARAPHPPLDFAPDGSGGFLDGGLPRHVVTGGSIANEKHTKTDWSKDLATMNAVQLPEDGTTAEKAAMAFFGKRCYPTFFPDGTQGSCPSSQSTNPQSTMLKPPTGFILNGLPLGPQHGAPFADPAVDDNGKAVGTKRTYKGAAIQLDVVFNKKGWHFPQQRMLTLWEDVAPTFAYKYGSPGGRQPEPLFFRGNSGDVIEYWHTNLVPNYYKLDDFQVRTPTDILGQHIHLVKFDVTSSDGAANGFNYEDGTFSPEEVQDMHKAITATGGSWTSCPGCTSTLRSPQPPPAEICSGPQAPHQCTSDWLGAQTTIQRWYLDPQLDDSGVDRTIRTVFTHDHFGPSTHQQAGLYAGLLVEPKGSTWTSNDGTQTFGSRPDGGPTSWQARILTSKAEDSYREFMLEFQDLQLAYQGVLIGGVDHAINAPSTPNLISTGMDPVPPGTQSLNYTNEPIPWRVGQFGDLSYAYDSSFKLASNAPANGDPYTPLMRAYQNDNVQIRVLVGAHVFAHQFDLEGPTWFAEPSWKNSGYRSVQAMGLSEHFELLFKVPSSTAPSTGRKCPDGMSQANCADYLYSPSLDVNGITNGLWGLFRAYDPTKEATSLKPLPNNPINASANVTYATCPAAATRRVYNVTAVTAQKALSKQSPFPGQIVFNSRGNPHDTLTNSLGIMYVMTEDLASDGTLKIGTPVEPLVLRANAGDCIEVNLTNALDPTSAVFSKDNTWAPPFNGVPVQRKTSNYVGLHPQLLSYDGAQSSGQNIGWNSQGQKNQVAAFGQTVKYEWYAGKIDRDAAGNLKYMPVEFGSLNLFPSDPVFQHLNGLFGAMIIEPQGSTWQCGNAGSLADCYPSSTGTPPGTRTSATVTLSDKKTTFREFTIMTSDDIRISPTVGGDVANSGAINYRTEPWQFRYVGNTTQDFSCMLSNQLVSADPQTPIFSAEVGDMVRFRMLHPFGTGTSQVFTISGHSWQRNPYAKDSTVIGSNSLSQWLGSRDNYGSTDHADIVIGKAGGESGQAGDYLYTVFVFNQARQGSWGIFRVGHAGAASQTNAACKVIPKPGYAPKAPPDDLDRFLRQPQVKLPPKQ